ncbi:MAG: CHAT domain-containing protein [Deltaproteobacteria bacterium]|nr:MAG: CHAT domain-containing protein [Deltaproteobacteria bacterium]
MADASKDLERLLEAREAIDRRIKAEHARHLAVLFTDLVGSTEYFERHGDIEGVALVRRVNEVLIPEVERHQGRVVKTIGDAVMAVFEAPEQAVAAAVAMQRALAARRAEAPEPLLPVRIGIHYGEVVEDGGDVFGDAVNTASRVESAARPHEIWISRAARPEGELAAALEPRGSVPLKGKQAPLEVYAVRWEEGEAREAPQAAAPEPGAAAAPRAVSAEEIFVLEIGRGPTGLRVAALDGRKGKGPVRSYDEVPLAEGALDDLASRFDAFLQGDASTYVDRLRALGSTLFEQALSDRARRLLRSTHCSFLRLHLDDAASHVPWELLHDGEAFLALRFGVGRVVSARGEPAHRPPPAQPRAVIVADPCGDLPEARREGEAVAELLQEAFAGEVTLHTGEVSAEAFLGALEGASLVHFAGHAEAGHSGQPAGFRLADRRVLPDEVPGALGQSAPDLFFVNACHASSRATWTEEARGTADVAASLLMAGIRHYLGPHGRIPDVDGLAFALRFYEALLAGEPIGQSVTQARRLLQTSAAMPLSFTRYVLYGEPRSILAGGRRAAGATRAAAAATAGTAPVSGTGLLDALAGPTQGAAAARATAALPAATGSAPPGAGTTPAGRRAAWALKIGAAVLLAALAGTVRFWIDAVWRAVVPEEDAQAIAATLVGDDASAAGAGGLPAEPEAARRAGPLRITVLPFTVLNEGERLGFLAKGLQESLITDFGTEDGVKFVERAQLKQALGEADLTRSHLWDQRTRARIGKMIGGEMIVIGSVQFFGGKARAVARFVDVETGEILGTAKVDGPADDPFTLQDALAEKVRALLPVFRERFAR